MRPLFTRPPWYVMIPACAVIIGLAPSITMLVLARQVHIAKAEILPYAASARIDADKNARGKLDAQGFQFLTDISGRKLTLSMHGSLLPDAAYIELYRPDDASADQHLPWTDTAQPLVIDLDRPGAWRVRLIGRVGGTVARLAETPFEAGA
jgi:hypothetical protein